MSRRGVSPSGLAEVGRKQHYTVRFTPAGLLGIDSSCRTARSTSTPTKVCTGAVAYSVAAASTARLASSALSPTATPCSATPS